jgi:hypothetical protein
MSRFLGLCGNILYEIGEHLKLRFCPEPHTVQSIEHYHSIPLLLFYN